MDRPRPTPLPLLRVEPVAEWAENELMAAIALVAEGGARRITIANVEVTDDLAGHGAVLAQQAGVAFAVDRDPVTGRRALRIGPRL